MRIHELLHAHLDGVDHVVDLTDERIDLREALRLPESVRYSRSGLDEATRSGPGAGTLLLCAPGPTAPAHAEPDALAPLLRELRPGARLIAVLGWRIGELPYHRLLGPLVDGRCQILAAAPVERVPVPGAQCAIVVERVERLATVPSYLVGPGGRARDEPDVPAAEALPTLLRMANEYVFLDLVSRPLRRRVVELERELADRDARLPTLQDELARSRARVAALESSLSFQIGAVVAEGIRRPVHAVRRMPRMWPFPQSGRNGRAASPDGSHRPDADG
ncbi:hypothetical protein [Plantactinospora soyae]|uniref:Uncharacterized protein n=1 Tax=Plantactinospora soyae TaxID=1544732 RepID=A0A927M5R4_9ACTN|nr:hypothetical protein [Plantactinospora soyae]MBE1488673.1 hypothetical protein [Plantactinospora soyae]